MKKLFILILVSLIPVIANANCYNIKDSDEKNNCLAFDKNQTSYCYNIKNSDIKNECLAKLKNQRNYCYNIQNQDKKNSCLTFVK